MAYILIVNNNPKTTRRLTNMLSQDEHRVVFTSNVFKALEALDHKEPDLVLTCIDMPDLDGHALARVIRTYHPTLPVIALSDTTDACESNFDAIIEKPFIDIEFMAAINTILNQK